MNTLLRWGLAAALALGGTAVFAAKTVEVARVKLVLTEDAWVASEDLPYNLELVSAQGTFRGNAKVLTLRAADGTPQAVLYVAATWGRPQVYTFRGDCQPIPGAYVRDLNDSKLENRRCLAFGQYAYPPALMESLLRGMNGASKSTQVEPPNEGEFILLHVTARGGLHIRIEGMFATGFAGLPEGKPVGDLPSKVSPASASWADTLAEAALKALTSFSGALPVPPVTFTNTPK